MDHGSVNSMNLRLCPRSICQRFTANYWNFVTSYVSVGYFIAERGFIVDTSPLAAVVSTLSAAASHAGSHLSSRPVDRILPQLT